MQSMSSQYLIHVVVVVVVAVGVVVVVVVVCVCRWGGGAGDKTTTVIIFYKIIATEMLSNTSISIQHRYVYVVINLQLSLLQQWYHQNKYKNNK